MNDNICPECEGSGQQLTSCCGDFMEIGGDLCPTCHEHCLGDEEPCEVCEGTGTKKQITMTEDQATYFSTAIQGDYLPYTLLRTLGGFVIMDDDGLVIAATHPEIYGGRKLVIKNLSPGNEKAKRTH